MINKIKDFLKNKLGRKASKNYSDQDEISNVDQTNPTINLGSLSDNEYDSIRASGKLTLSEKISRTFSSLKNKISPPKITALGNNKQPSKDDTGPLISPSLSRNIEKFLARTNRESIHQASLIIFICAITFSLGKMAALVVGGDPALDSPKDYTVSISRESDFNPATLTQVKRINIFRTNSGQGGKKGSIADKKCEEAEGKSNLPIKLVNTIVLQDTVKSIASVQIRGDRALQEVRVGDEISNLAKIFKITRLEILVKNLESGMCESIASGSKDAARGSPISVMSPSQSRDYKANKKISGIENVGNKFSISKTLLDEKLKDLGAILTQAKAVQIQNPDGSLSFKMTELDPTGIFPFLGIQDQDIITTINGKPVNSLNEVMQLFGRIKNLENLSLGIKREGSDSVQEYSIKK